MSKCQKCYYVMSPPQRASNIDVFIADIFVPVFAQHEMVVWYGQVEEED